MTKTQMQQQLTTPVWRSPCDGSVHLFGPLNVFEDEFDDGTFVEYGAEYMRYLLSHENATWPSPLFMARQPHISWESRAQVLRWMHLAATSTQLSSDTLQIAISIIDRFASQHKILAKDYHAIAAVAIFTSAKYEENHGRVPTLKQLRKLLPTHFSAHDLCLVERAILTKLNFAMAPSAETFRRFQTKSLDIIDARIKILSQYLIEIFAFSPRSPYYKPSEISLSSTLLAEHIVKDVKRNYDGHTLKCMNDLMFVAFTPAEVVYTKFAPMNFLNVSVLLEKWLEGRKSFTTSFKSRVPYPVTTTGYNHHPHSSHHSTSYLTPPPDNYPGVSHTNNHHHTQNWASVPTHTHNHHNNNQPFTTHHHHLRSSASSTSTSASASSSSSSNATTARERYTHHHPSSNPSFSFLTTTTSSSSLPHPAFEQNPPPPDHIAWSA